MAAARCVHINQCKTFTLLKVSQITRYLEYKHPSLPSYKIRNITLRVLILYRIPMYIFKVCHKNGEFVAARPIEGTILVNIGDLLQRWTNDKLVSTVSISKILKNSAKDFFAA